VGKLLRDVWVTRRVPATVTHPCAVLVSGKKSLSGFCQRRGAHVVGASRAPFSGRVCRRAIAESSPTASAS